MATLPTLTELSNAERPRADRETRDRYLRTGA
jgi:hypothetical protein